MSRRVYLVQRRAVQGDIRGWTLEERTVHPDGGFLPWHPLRLFADERAALAFADEVRDVIRLEMNPFELCRNFEDATSLPFDDFRLQVAELGLPLPGEEPYLLTWWWAEQHLAGLSDAQRDAVWALLDRLKLVRVIPLPLDDA